MSTIAAISTAQGQGGIGVIRVSGEQAFTIVDKIFKSVSGKKIMEIKGYTALFGHIYNNEEVLDEAVVLKYVAPKSFTGENVVEISCHGGMYITKEVLNAVIMAGASLAEPGEFTKRAYLNGKMDLTEAESVMDIISAKSKSAARAALFVKDGALAPMLERILNAALEGEMDAHLREESRESGNRRNGKMPKTVQTQYGEVTVETPRDRNGSFDPQTVRKRETILAEGMADQIIGMYAFGTSTREISRYFEREFNTRLSAETISAITDRVLPEIKEWKSRSLESVYAICWLDAIHYKVKDDSGRAVTRAIYNVLGYQQGRS